jgi:hypothetical protein
VTLSKLEFQLRRSEAARHVAPSSYGHYLRRYAPIAFEFVTTGSQQSRTRDSTRVYCVPEEELGDTIMAGIEEDAMADDVDAPKQFYE